MRNDKESEPEFDHFAESYEELLRDPIRDIFSSDGAAFFHERKRDLIRQWFRRQSRETRSLSYLDVGCGKGELLQLLASDFAKVSGCDPSPGMLNTIQHATTRVQTEPTRIPFDSASFDFVTAVCVYHHVPPGARHSLTKDIVRVLRPGGLFCIIEHNPLNPATRLIVSRTPVDADAVLLYNWQTSDLMKRAGLKIAGLEYFLYFPASIYRKIGGVEALLRALPLGGQYATFGIKS